MIKLSPSILSADFANLLEDVNKVESYADYLHIDVMDGHFVPNISFGAPVMKCLVDKTKTSFDVHLMIENPEKYIKDFVTSQTEYITVHYEVLKERTNEVLNLIKSFNIKAGLVLNPETDVNLLVPYLDNCDMVLVMSVHPGFGGQKFIPESIDKVKFLDSYRKENNLNYLIEIDGGISLDNVDIVKDAGCDVFVAGSKIFSQIDIEKAAKEFKIR